MKHLLLIGFMASGKSTLAKLLSSSLNLPIFSTDSWITLQAQKSISEIFSLYGEGEFRLWEKRAFEEISKLEKPHIIDCGGGFILGNNVSKLGRVYYLKVSLEETQRRLSQKEQRLTRPLSKDVENLYFQREGLYIQRASKVIEENNQEEVLKEIMQDWKKHS